MYRYTYSIPVGQLFKLWDGHVYANAPYLVGPRGPVKVDGLTRMVRADDAPIVDGMAQVWIGSMGGAIAVLDGLPDGVQVHRPEPSPDGVQVHLPEPSPDAARRQSAQGQALLDWINTHDCGVTPCGVANPDGSITIRVADNAGGTHDVRIRTIQEALAALGY
jgi:hypothetical protein